MSVIVPIDMPGACNDCPFMSRAEEISVGNGMYTKICNCTIAPEEIEDTYNNLHWLVNNKPEWCPLKEAKRKQTIVNCENCYHFDVCKNYLAELGYTLGVDYKATRCPFYKDKSLLVERKALYEKVEELLIGHGYINPDTAILECLEIIENFSTEDVEPERTKETDDERKTK